MTERKPTIPRMGRRCHHWDYSARAIYLLTLTLAQRGRPLLARWPEPRPQSPGWMPIRSVSGPAQNLPIVGGRSRSATETAPSQWLCPPTPAGLQVLSCWHRIPEFWPQVELFCHQVMPDHFHGILFVRERLPDGKTLGDIVRGFKTGCREVGWSPGFVDTILSGEGHLSRMKAYVHANPDRLAAKRAHPDLFRLVRDVAVGSLRFQALGNLSLLDWPLTHPVQCSRADFAYRRTRLPGGNWKTLRAPDGTPLPECSTPVFEATCTAALEAAARGAVLVSPCLSPGEREIARRAFSEGGRVIVLRNKGFAPAEKPQGALFRMCEAGRLLLLAPSGWPWVPGNKTLRREEALALNRMAQMISSNGATPTPIPYHGAVCRDIDSLVRQACAPATA